MDNSYVGQCTIYLYLISFACLGLSANDPPTIRLNSYLQSRFRPELTTTAFPTFTQHHVTSCNHSQAPFQPQAPPLATPTATPTSSQQPPPACTVSNKVPVTGGGDGAHRFSPYSLSFPYAGEFSPGRHSAERR